MNATKPDSNVLLQHATTVLDLEIDGLKALKDRLDDTFLEALDLVLKCQGRVIISGMGKSGHIARKIAATMASTGTPALFVHPAEAGHGDLGMITETDLIFAISNSGESAELDSILLYAKRIEIPVISVTSRPGSTLARNGTVVLLTPNSKEACPFELAPTTSTTVTLALGDALAIALMHARGFTPGEFGKFHPGGKLGAQLKTCEEVIDQVGHIIPLVSTQAPMSDVLAQMNEGRLGCTGVTDDQGNLVGVITDGDLRRGLKDEGLLSKIAGDLMGSAPVTISDSMLAVEALNLMEDKKITAVFVTEGQQPVGIIHLHDLLDSKTA